jgi:hypothetical protein
MRHVEINFCKTIPPIIANVKSHQVTIFQKSFFLFLIPPSAVEPLRFQTQNRSGAESHEGEPPARLAPIRIPRGRDITHFYELTLSEN